MPDMNWPTAFVTLFCYSTAIGGWVFGIAVAKGFWMTAGAVCIPPMAWVLVAQWVLERLS
jgi:hypothetical protein